MARIRREELKHDEFIDSVDAALLYLEEHGRKLAVVGLVLILAGSAGGWFYWDHQQKEKHASLALGKAMMTFEAPVQAGLPPLPGQDTQVFSSEQEKYEAAAKGFAHVHETYPRTQAGRVARHYEAICQFELGQKEEALRTLEELSRGRHREEAALVQLHLAGFYAELGRRDDAARLYRELIDKPTTAVPRPVALFHLAGLESESNPAEARQLYEQIKAEFPDSDIATEMSRRLDLLPRGASAAGEDKPLSSTDHSGEGTTR